MGRRGVSASEEDIEKSVQRNCGGGSSAQKATGSEAWGLMGTGAAVARGACAVAEPWRLAAGRTGSLTHLATTGCEYSGSTVCRVRTVLS